MAWKQKNPSPKRSSSSSPRKATIPVAFREQIWLRTCGKVYETKCSTRWCQNRITVFDFQSGHNIPESKGGPTTPENLIPLCSRCNLSMGNRYTFDEWNKLSNITQTTPEPVKKPWWLCCT
jgi:5-methylcytosine-specific restriction endonuclease McrA